MTITILSLGMLQTNCYILSEKGRCLVIDPGAELERIRKACEGRRIEAILLTHGHFDHVGGVKALMEACPGLPVYVHADDTDLGDHLGKGLVWTDHYAEGDVLTMDSLTFRVMNTPGHTPGSVCIAVEDVLLTGDTLFAGSCGRTDFPKGSWSQMTASLRRLAAMDGSLQVLSGHGEPSTLERERDHNPYMKEALEG